MNTSTLLKTLILGMIFIGGCVSHPAKKQDEIIIYSGEHVISTFVNEHGQFKKSKIIESTIFDLSGTVEKQHDNYIVSIQFNENDQINNSKQKLKTTIMLKKNEFILLSGSESLQSNWQPTTREKEADISTIHKVKTIHLQIK